ncbi:hypothetical protein [Ammoniphilus resinae]|uniref:Uncharacterized protein n=1 Tax=Ammoniphilus resinae TaxID=861532 RepID=A0ABS4GPW2_9BACL|nr:hypothetical protein [Ammoniphilus resinae]MBP1932266.1 hypothetical protein [Ammoniphilus resinae]
MANMDNHKNKNIPKTYVVHPTSIRKPVRREKDIGSRSEPLNNPLRSIRITDGSFANRLTNKYGWSVGRSPERGTMIHRRGQTAPLQVSSSPIHSVIFMRNIHSVLQMHFRLVDSKLRTNKERHMDHSPAKGIPRVDNQRVIKLFNSLPLVPTGERNSINGTNREVIKEYQLLRNQSGKTNDPQLGIGAGIADSINHQGSWQRLISRNFINHRLSVAGQTHRKLLPALLNQVSTTTPTLREEIISPTIKAVREKTSFSPSLLLNVYLESIHHNKNDLIDFPLHLITNTQHREVARFQRVYAMFPGGDSRSRLRLGNTLRDQNHVKNVVQQDQTPQRVLRVQTALQYLMQKQWTPAYSTVHRILQQRIHRITTRQDTFQQDLMQFRSIQQRAEPGHLGEVVRLQQTIRLETTLHGEIQQERPQVHRSPVRRRRAGLEQVSSNQPTVIFKRIPWLPSTVERITQQHTTILKLVQRQLRSQHWIGGQQAGQKTLQQHILRRTMQWQTVQDHLMQYRALSELNRLERQVRVQQHTSRFEISRFHQIGVHEYSQEAIRTQVMQWQMSFGKAIPNGSDVSQPRVLPKQNPWLLSIIEPIVQHHTAVLQLVQRQLWSQHRVGEKQAGQKTLQQHILRRTTQWQMVQEHFLRHRALSELKRLEQLVRVQQHTSWLDFLKFRQIRVHEYRQEAAARTQVTRLKTRLEQFTSNHANTAQLQGLPKRYPWLLSTIDSINQQHTTVLQVVRQQLAHNPEVQQRLWQAKTRLVRMQHLVEVQDQTRASNRVTKGLTTLKQNLHEVTLERMPLLLSTIRRITHQRTTQLHIVQQSLLRNKIIQHRFELGRFERVNRKQHRMMRMETIRVEKQRHKRNWVDLYTTLRQEIQQQLTEQNAIPQQSIQQPVPLLFSIQQRATELRTIQRHLMQQQELHTLPKQKQKQQSAVKQPPVVQLQTRQLRLAVISAVNRQQIQSQARHMQDTPLRSITQHRVGQQLVKRTASARLQTTLQQIVHQQQTQMFQQKVMQQQVTATRQRAEQARLQQPVVRQETTRLHVTRQSPEALREHLPQQIRLEQKTTRLHVIREAVQHQQKQVINRQPPWWNTVKDLNHRQFVLHENRMGTIRKRSDIFLQQGSWQRVTREEKEPGRAQLLINRQNKQKVLERESVVETRGQRQRQREAIRLDVLRKNTTNKPIQESALQTLQQAIKTVENDLNQTKEQWAKPTVDVNRLVDQMYKEFSRRMRIEQQRRGM